MIDADVYGNNNATEESVTEATERPEIADRPKPLPRPDSPAVSNENCNASTPTIRVTPQEVHHHHHHYLPKIPNNSCSSPDPFDENDGESNNVAGSESIKQLSARLRDTVVVLESLRQKVGTLSDVVDELINSSSSSKLLLTGAKIDTTTNLFELVRHILLDRLDLKDLRNDIYSATRTKDGVVFDVASGLDKRRILARARERLQKENDIRIQDYYVDIDVRVDSEQLLDTRFG